MRRRGQRARRARPAAEVAARRAVRDGRRRGRRPHLRPAPGRRRPPPARRAPPARPSRPRSARAAARGAARAGGRAGALGRARRRDGRPRLRPDRRGRPRRTPYHRRPHPRRAARGVRGDVRAAHRGGRKLRPARPPRRSRRRPRRAPARRPPLAAHPLPPRRLEPPFLPRRRLRGGGRRAAHPGRRARPGRPAPGRRAAGRARAAAVARRGRAPRTGPRLRRPRTHLTRTQVIRQHLTQGAVVIRFEDVSVTYDGAAEPTVAGVDFEVPEGELVLLVGPSGVGKSTILGAVSGLVPHFTGGTLRGRVTVAGRDTRTHKPRELADVVGTVGQDPLSHFVTDTVEDELAYGMESLGLAPEVMRRRVEETLDLLGLAALRDRPIATLSGGQQQRVAIGSVLTPHPKVLVLDEPTSALDPAAAEEVLAVLQRLVHDLGTTVLMAEHRLERVVQYADQVVLLPAPGAAPQLGAPADIMAVSPVYPPVVALGRLADWTPLPLTVRDARRRAAPLRD
ncbi:ABC transporter ATP-binding protein, partial [Streptomyces sp. e14]